MEAVVVIGGGFAGSAASYFLTKAGLRPLLLEAKEEAGGGSRGLKVFGEEVPLGARALRLRESTELNVLKTLAELFPRSSKLLLTEQERGLVYWKGKLLPFPIQSGFSNLPIPQRIPYLLSYLFRSRQEPTNFAEWAESQWGRRLAEPVIKLSRKSWATDPTFVALKATEKIKESWTPSVLRSGILGTQIPGVAGKVYDETISSTELVQAFLRDVQVKTNSKVKRGGIRFNVDGSGGSVETEHGGGINFRHLVSTIPLAAFHHLVHPSEVDDKTSYHFDCLNYNHLVVLAFPVSWEVLPTCFRRDRRNNIRMIYFPEGEIFQRMSFASTFTKLKQKGIEILVCEISIPRSFRNPHNEFFQDFLFHRCVRDLEQNGFFNVKFRDSFFSDFPASASVLTPGYLIFDRHYEVALEGIEEWSAEKPITFFGRYGAWNNWEIDHVICEAKELTHYIGRRLE